MRILLFLSIIIAGCSSKKNEAYLLPGKWKGELSLSQLNKSIKLPFRFDLIEFSSDGAALEIINGEEKIKVDNIKVINDSIFIHLPFYDSEIKAQIGGNSLKGRWYNYARGADYNIPFVASYNQEDRFYKDLDPMFDVNGRWEVDFSPGKKDAYKAVGEFNQTGHKVTGTFLTEIGDYRYLEGIVSGNQLSLSCFDGAHAFLFKAQINPGGSMHGHFWSGKHWKENWVAIKNEEAKLKDAHKLTYLNEGYDKFEFIFPDIYGNNVSLNDHLYKNKPVIVQIMGTWCPNCVDEIRMLAELHRKYKKDGLEVIALAFEKTQDNRKILKSVLRLKQKLQVNYEFLIAGKADKKEAAKVLPMLNHIMSYPTTIFLDKQHNVRKIHTGFSGPGTGEHYTRLVHEFTATIENLLLE